MLMDVNSWTLNRYANCWPFGLCSEALGCYFACLWCLGSSWPRCNFLAMTCFLHSGLQYTTQEGTTFEPLGIERIHASSSTARRLRSPRRSRARPSKSSRRGCPWLGLSFLRVAKQGAERVHDSSFQEPLD